MSWLYHKSSTWRGVVQFTRRSALNMALFSAAIMAVAWYGGSAVMERCVDAPTLNEHPPVACSTNPPVVPDYLKQQSIEHKVGWRDVCHDVNVSIVQQILARANKERLAVLLDEVKGRSNTSDERYAAALRCAYVGGVDLMLACSPQGREPWDPLVRELSRRCGALVCVALMSTPTVFCATGYQEVNCV